MNIAFIFKNSFEKFGNMLRICKALQTKIWIVYCKDNHLVIVISLWENFILLEMCLEAISMQYESANGTTNVFSLYGKSL